MSENDVQNDGYQGQSDDTSGADRFNELNFLIKQVLNGIWTITLCSVKSVSGGGATSGPATITAQPLVNQMNGQNQATPHGIINNIPVSRIQGGTGAFISDPVVGDIGILAFASRDISSVKKNAAVSNPGSNRTFDAADGIYLGSLLGKAPDQFVQVSKDGITLNFAPNCKATFNGDGFTLTAGGCTIVCNNGKITLNGIVWDTHVHLVGSTPSGPPKAP